MSNERKFAVNVAEHERVLSGSGSASASDWVRATKGTISLTLAPAQTATVTDGGETPTHGGVEAEHSPKPVNR